MVGGRRGDVPIAAVAWAIVWFMPSYWTTTGDRLFPGIAVLGATSLAFVVAFDVVIIIAASVSARTLGRRVGGIVLASAAFLISLTITLPSIQYYGLGGEVFHMVPLPTARFDMAGAVVSLVWMSLVFLSWALTYPIRGTGYLGILLVVTASIIGYFGAFTGVGFWNALVHALAAIVLPAGAIAVAIAGSRASIRRKVSQPVRGAYAVTGDQAPRTNTMAVLGFVFAFFFSILGVVFSHVALSQIGRTGDGGRGFAIAGLVIGYVSIVVGIAVIIWQVLLFQSMMSAYGY